LPCSLLLLALLASLITFSTIVAAQEERPQITPDERKAPRKKDAGPRAVAVVKLTPNGKASLLPIAILVNGKFWDATAYKADPVPMALDSGTVYEAEQSGSSLGLFTVNSALRSNAANREAPWLGTGSWRPTGTEEPNKELHAETVPVGIDTTEGPPRLSHDTSATKNAPASTPASTPSNNPSSPSVPSKPSSDSGDEPPRLSKGDPPPSSSPESAPQTPAAVPEPTVDLKPKDAKPSQPKAPASDSGTTEANRPRLRREKPAESFADEDVPGYSKPGSSPSSTVSAATPAKPADTPAAKSDVKLIPAISDAGGPAPRSFTYEWLRGDEADRRKQMIDLAKDQIRAYVDAQAKAKIATTPKPARPTTARRTITEPILENVQITAYDLWNSNQAIIILSADAHMPGPPAGTAHSEVETELQYSIVLVAYPDIYNNLRKLYSGITDKFHLDMTPRLELVDAVDADGDGRGELLFRQTSDAGNGWVIYRATADKLWKLYDSQNPQ
jgi:hypothetical protein